MTYYLIGSGNMAWFLAGRMQAGGHTCVGLWARNSAAAAKLARAYHVPLLQSMDELHDGPDACLLAVSDGAIEEIAASLTLQTTVLMHHSGGAPMGVLGKAPLQGIAWPVYSILKDELPVHRNFPTVWEANGPAARKVVQEVCTAISGIRYEAAPGQRQWLHLTAVMGNNFTNYLLGMCTDICSRHGLPASLLQPILQQTLDRIGHTHPRLLQTGPARRHDEPTIERQLNMLQDAPHWQAVYRALTEAIKNTYAASRPGD